MTAWMMHTSGAGQPWLVGVPPEGYVLLYNATVQFFIRTPSPAGDKILGPYEPSEALQRVARLRDQGAEYVVTDENGKVVDTNAIARGDILSMRDEELVSMMENEFPAIWKAALENAHGHRSFALSTIVRLVRRHIEVAASERERRLTGGSTSAEQDM